VTIPTTQQFKQVALQTVNDIQAWAKDTFCLAQLPVKLTITDRRLRFYGQAQVLRDKQENFQAFGIKLSSHDFTHYQQIAVCEYKSYNGHPEIGGFESSDWMLGVRALVAHEMSHVIQFALKMSAFDHKAVGSEHPLVTSWKKITPVFGAMGEFESGHGALFQSIYRSVRRHFINDQVASNQYTSPRVAFDIPDTFEERLLEMPKTGLEGVRFMNSGRWLEVVGRNPNRNKLFGYQVRDDAGNFFRCKMSLIVLRSDEAQRIVDGCPKLQKEWHAHKITQHNKTVANQKSRVTKARRNLARAA